MPDDDPRKPAPLSLAGHERIIRALLAPPPEVQRRIEHFAFFLAGYRDGLAAARTKRKRGAPKKTASERRWTPDRYIKLLADVELLKSRTDAVVYRCRTDLEACRIIVKRRPKYAGRYPIPKSPHSLRDRVTEARRELKPLIYAPPTVPCSLNAKSWRAVSMYALKKYDALEYCDDDERREGQILMNVLRQQLQ